MMLWAARSWTYLGGIRFDTNENIVHLKELNQKLR